MGLDLFAIDPYTKGVGLDADVGQGAVLGQVGLRQPPGLAKRDEPTPQTKTFGEPRLERRRRDEREGGLGGRPSSAREHRSAEHRLRGRDRRVRITDGRPGDHTCLEHDMWSDPEEAWVPKDEIGELARLDRAD